MSIKKPATTDQHRLPINFLQVRAALDRERYHPSMLFPVVLTAIGTLTGVLLALYLAVTS